MVYFMCQLEWVRGCPDIWLNIILEKLLDIGLVNDLFDMTPKAQEAKAKIDKCEWLHQTKMFLFSKKTISKMKTQSKKWEKISANHMCDEV